MRILLVITALFSINSMASSTNFEIEFNEYITSPFVTNHLEGCTKVNNDLSQSNLCEVNLSIVMAGYEVLTNVPQDIKNTLKNKVVRKCKSWTGCKYSSGQEYIYTKKLHSVYKIDNNVVAIYTGHGGEWARQTGDFFFYIVNEEAEFISWNRVEVWSELN